MLFLKKGHSILCFQQKTKTKMSQFYRNIILTFEDGTIKQEKIFTSAPSNDIIDKYMDLEVFDEKSKTLKKVMKIQVKNKQCRPL